MTITVSHSVSAPRSYGRTDSVPPGEYGKIFRDQSGDLFVILENNGMYGQAARVRSDHLDLDTIIHWPLEIAPLGTSITITNEG